MSKFRLLLVVMMVSFFISYASADLIDITRASDGHSVGILSFDSIGAGQNAFSITFLHLPSLYDADTCDASCSLTVSYLVAPSSGFATITFADGSTQQVNFPAGNVFDIFGSIPITDFTGASVVFSDTIQLTGASFTGNNVAGDMFSAMLAAANGNTLTPEGIVSVPEPATLLLMGSMLVGFGRFARRGGRK